MIINKYKQFIFYLVEIPNFFSFFLFTFFSFSISPVLLEIGKSFNTNATNIVLIFTFYSAGMIIGRLTSLLYIHKFPKLHLILYAYALLFFTIIALFLVHSLYLLYLLYFISGYLLGIVWVMSVGNLLESKIENKVRLLGVALVFNALGAILSPILSSSLVNNNLNWRFIYILTSFLVVIIFFLYIAIQKNNKYSETGKQKNKITVKNIFFNKNKNRLFTLCNLTLFFYVMAEIIIITWSPTFFRIERQFDVKSAAIAVTIFWIMVLFGRIISSYVVAKINNNHLILIFSIVAFISIFFVAYLKLKYSVYISIAFIGLGCSGLYPLLTSLGATIYEEGRDFLATIMYTTASIGTLISPYFIKIASNYKMILPIILAIFFMGFAIIFHIISLVYDNLQRRS